MPLERIPQWVPDWQNSSQYPRATKNVPMERWAWEFLRRNPDYQADYERLAVITGDGEAILAIRSKYFAGKMPDPALEYCEKVRQALHFRAYQSPGYLMWNKGPNSVGLCVTQPGDIAVKFNVSLPLDVQLKRTEILLRRIRKLNLELGWIKSKQKRRPSPLLLKRFLRVLDGHQNGVSARDMAAKLLPNENDLAPDHPATKKIRANLKSAQTLFEIGYIDLVYLEAPENLIGPD
jgi:hypothetical protein